MHHDTRKSEASAVVKQRTPKELKMFLLQNSHAESDLTDALAKCTEILSRPRPKTKHQKERTQEELQEPVRTTLLALEVDSHLATMESFDPKYRGMVKEIANQIIREYDCGTHAEKMLAENAVSGFVRYIDYSKRFNSCINAAEEITPNLSPFLGMLGKQMDRAHRHFTSSLAMLKQLKQPQLEINIRAKNAFVAENQQINADAHQS